MTRLKFLLALDQGTSSSRSIVFNAQGEIVAKAQREFRQIFPQPGRVEHDPNEIWSSQIATAQEALAQAGIGAADEEVREFGPSARKSIGDANLKLVAGGEDGWDAWAELMRARQEGRLVADGFGLVAGGAAEAGYGAGGGYQGSSGVGVLWGKGVRPGGFTGSGQVGTVDPYKDGQFVAGGGAAAGGGVFFTNADSWQQLAGTSRVTSINLWLVTIQYAESGSTWMLSITGGPGTLAGVSSYNVDTVGTVGR